MNGVTCNQCLGQGRYWRWGGSDLVLCEKCAGLGSVNGHDADTPAFPNIHTGTFDGMSLRDYFAAKAMQSMTAGPGARMVADRDARYDETNWAEIVATNAYAMADAMLVERAKRVRP